MFWRHRTPVPGNEIAEQDARYENLAAEPIVVAAEAVLGHAAVRQARQHHNRQLFLHGLAVFACLSGAYIAAETFVIPDIHQAEAGIMHWMTGRDFELGSGH